MSTLERVQWVIMTPAASLASLPAIPTKKQRFSPLFTACFIEVGDFTGQAIKRAVENGLRRGFFVGMAGKLTKLAAGVMMTHWTRSKVDNDLLAEITAGAGGSPGLVREVEAANTARHAYELWRAAHLERAPYLLCGRVAENLCDYAGGEIEMHAIMVDFDTLEPVGASPGALELTTWSKR